MGEEAVSMLEVRVAERPARASTGAKSDLGDLAGPGRELEMSAPTRVSGGDDAIGGAVGEVRRIPWHRDAPETAGGDGEPRLLADGRCGEDVVKGGDGRPERDVDTQAEV
jgi:hypothetical protein